MTTMRDKAEALVEAWAPYCERIEIAGSIRRGKPDPHDIEIVAVPKRTVAVARRDMFEDHEVTMTNRNRFDEYLGLMKADGRLRDRLDKNGRPAWGERFKRALGSDGTAIDIFSVVPPAQWGVIFAIRTGPADFSHALVTPTLQGGFMPGGMRQEGGALWRLNDVVPTPEEDDFFRELGVPCWPPAERGLMRLAEWRRQRKAVS